jgi:cation diffusion facilitator family transporter
MLGALIIVVVGLLVMYESYTKLFIVRELKYGNIAIGTALIAMIISTVMLVYKIKMTRSLELLSMKTEVVNSATDSLSSISAFLGITLADKLGIIQFDSIVGIVIGIFVLVSSYVIIKESSLVLMDACQCSEILTDIENISKSVKHVNGVHDIRMRKLGSYLIGDMHVVVDADMSVREADQIATQIEERLTQEFDEVIEIKVRIEPPKPSTS